MLNPLSLGYVIMAVLSIGPAGYFYWTSGDVTARQYIKENPETSPLSPMGLICRAHNKIAKLRPSSPDEAVTLFSVLGLNPPNPPFFPTDAYLYPYGYNYEATRRTISNAWMEANKKHDGHMREWRSAYSLAALALLNDTLRSIYMKDVLPKMGVVKGNAESV